MKANQKQNKVKLTTSKPFEEVTYVTVLQFMKLNIHLFFHFSFLNKCLFYRIVGILIM